MDKRIQVKHFLQEIAEQEIPADSNPWPAIRTKMSNLPRKQQQTLTGLEGNTHSRHPRRMSRVLVLLCVASLILIWGQVAASASAQAVLQQMLERFGLVLIGSTMIEPPSPADPSRVTEEFHEIPAISLAEAQRQISFPIRRPTWLPPGLALKGARVMPPGWVNVFYAPTNGAEVGGGGIEISQGGGSGGTVFPASATEEVLVLGRPAIYIHGAWDQHLRWNGAADASTLSWEADGFTYKLQFSELGFTREDMIRIAESVR